MVVFPFDNYLAEPETAGSSGHGTKQHGSDARSPSQLQFQLPSFLSGDSSILTPGVGSTVFSAAMFPGFATLPRVPVPGSFYDDSALLMKDDWNKTSITPYHPKPSEKESAMPFDYPTEADNTVVESTTEEFIPEAVYSRSGFDMLSLLGRVAVRPNPTVKLGPVDLTCAFVVADNRSPDFPIIYASQTFSELTGYEETEILGRNCRFLQAPNGIVNRGDARHYTSSSAVSEMMWALLEHREIQVTLVNYRKDGQPFINRVSIIPIDNYYVGFQVNLNDAPVKLPTKETNLFPHNPHTHCSLSSVHASSVSPAELSASAVSAGLRLYLSSRKLQSALSRSILQCSCGDTPDHRDIPSWLSFLLLHDAPDFVQVLSLKGNILYASPSVRRTLGYAPESLTRSTLSDLAHPNDSIPLLRELKEASMNATAVSHDDSSEEEYVFRTVDLLFRMRHGNGKYVWVSAMGRLHSEPGRGRKFIILSGRVCSAPSLTWSAIGNAGGVLLPKYPSLRTSNVNGSGSPLSPRTTTGDAADKQINQDREFWALLSPSGIFLSVGAGVRDVLGWGAGEVMGRAIQEFAAQNSSTTGLITETPFSLTDCGTSLFSPEFFSRSPIFPDIGRAISLTISDRQSPSRRVQLVLVHRNATSVPLEVIFYATNSEATTDCAALSPRHSGHVFAQFKTKTFTTIHERQAGLSHSLSEDVFNEIQPERPTSWQYELQKLKFANRDLRTEVSQLEKSLGY